MSLTIDQQKIVANTQTYDLENIVMDKPVETGQWVASLQFGVYSEDNVRIDTVVISYSESEFQDFWASFAQDGAEQFIYDELVAKQGLQVDTNNMQTSVGVIKNPVIKIQ